MPKATLILVAAIQASLPQDSPEEAYRSGVSAVPASREFESPAARPRTDAAFEFDGSAMNLSVPAPLTPSVEVRIDGRLNEEAWVGAPLLTGFTQFDPVEGVPEAQPTLVRFLVTEEALIFGILAQDDEEGGVRATLTKRDGFGRSDDYVRIILDTFDDGRRGYVFQVNPLGVQGDGIWLEGSSGRGDPIDWNPDFLWESAGMLTDSGYSAELKIPLKSLRFPDKEVQDWGLQVVRRIQRSGQQASWAPISGEKANQLGQSGKVRGLTGLEPGRFAEINPVLTAVRSGSWDSSKSALKRGAVAGEMGLNVAYGITSNLTLDATLNPDFSQVESDAGQITVNERFALFLPEKRPFFLEGTDVFSMPRQLVYTRSVANPRGATKLSGKVGTLSMAYIGAVDEPSGVDGNAVVNLFRLKGDLGESSSLGLTYTDRTVSGEQFNRVLGLDGRLILRRRYTLDLMAAGSADRLPGEDSHWGSLLFARMNRVSRHFSLNASFEDVGEDFRARSGFIRRVGVTRLESRIGYTWRGGEGALVESWGPSVEAQGYWAREDFWSGRSPQEMEFQLNLSGSFRGNVGGFLSYSRSSYEFSPKDYEGLFVLQEKEAQSGPGTGGASPFYPGKSLFSDLNAVRLRSWISRWERVRISVGASWNETPVFDRSGVPVHVADGLGGDLNLTFYPTGSFQAEVGVRHSRLSRKGDGSLYSSATIPRLQLRYQFNRALFVRGLGEYSSQRRGELLDPASGLPLGGCDDGCVAREGSEAFDFRLEGLLAYEPSPGTVVFFGYSRQMKDQGNFQFREVTTRADGLFLKVSYRFRT